MHILGISCYFHDAAAALLRDGQLLAAAEEERFSRRKHDSDFPQHAIDFCLRVAGLRGEDLDYVVFYEKPFLKFERILLSSLSTFPRSHRVFREAMLSWLGDKLWVKELIQRKLGVPTGRILFCEHHLSHAASAFLCSPFDRAAILTVDGVGEWTTASYGVGNGPEVRLLEEIRFPHSLGLFYSAFTAFLGFEVNEGEYKVMGMAPFGRPIYEEKIRQIIHVGDDGGFELDLRYFSFHHSMEQTYSPEFLGLFGQPRDPSSTFSTLTEDNQYYADIAASVQAVTEDVMLKMARRVHQRTGLSRLCLAGGVALNSAANGRLIRESPFEEFYVQPAAGDSGGALGAALYVWNCVLGKPRGFVLRHTAWGEEHSPSAVREFLQSHGIAFQSFSNETALHERVTERLIQGKVVGWVDGRFEWGPRALGHRSILADPRPASVKDLVNAKIKFREPFRPFAPAVPHEVAARFFDVSPRSASYPERFMLSVVNVCEEWRGRLPGITHVDGTARVQAVHRDTEPGYCRLIEMFGQATGVPVLLNTSFNLRAEPIVNTPGEAFSTFMKSGMDALVLGDCLVEKDASLA